MELRGVPSEPASEFAEGSGGKGCDSRLTTFSAEVRGGGARSSSSVSK